MQNTTPVFHPLAWLWFPQQWAQTLASSLVPNALTQAINPWSWVINVNSNNSSAPETERAVLEKHSYGRQLGHLNDVVALLLQHLGSSVGPWSADDQRAVDAFEQQKREIDEVKTTSARTRVDRLVADAERLERADPAAFAQLMQRLSGLGDDRPRLSSDAANGHTPA